MWHTPEGDPHKEVTYAKLKIIQPGQKETHGTGYFALGTADPKQKNPARKIEGMPLIRPEDSQMNVFDWIAIVGGAAVALYSLFSILFG